MTADLSKLPALLARMRETLAAAPRAPWKHDDGLVFFAGGGGLNVRDCDNPAATAETITFSRNLLPALLACCEALGKLRDEVCDCLCPVDHHVCDTRPHIPECKQATAALSALLTAAEEMKDD